MPDPIEPSMWEDRPDGSRVRYVNGIRIVDRRRPEPEPGDIEYLVAQQDDAGRVVIVGLDGGCRPIYTTTLYHYL